jgi:hypothetical protein
VLEIAALHDALARGLLTSDEIDGILGQGAAHYVWNAGSPDQHLALARLLKRKAARLPAPQPALRKANSFLALAKSTAKHVQMHRQHAQVRSP